MLKFNPKYIVTEPKKNLVVPKWGGNLKAETATRVMFLDNDVIPGAFYVECVWFWPGEIKDEASPDPHVHDYPEVLGFFGSDPNNVKDLGAEIEFFINGERNVMDKTFLAFVPAGVVHNPLHIHNITRPVFHFATFPGKEYTGKGK
ncbi:MAG TPA: hypothetical protein VMB24_03175 [Dehalococcoidales bacterium]|nr:hypothetical protein [Dehalococcoidales bacterium]